MNPMEKMMLEEKKQLKNEIIELFDSLNRDNFIEELENIAYTKLETLGIIHSYSIDLDVDDDIIYVYIDGQLSLNYKIKK